MNKIYTGIGATDTPLYIQSAFVTIGWVLASKGYILRSGHAPGADISFEFGCDVVSGSKEIYLPDPAFNGSLEKMVPISEAALELASTIHPNWEACKRKPFAMRAHGRNCYQALGVNLDLPSDFTICWTEGGRGQGGSRTAIQLALKNNRPVIDFGKFKKMGEALKELGKYVDF